MLDRDIHAVQVVAQRELLEETGLTVPAGDLFPLHNGPLYSSPGAADEGIYYFGCVVSLSAQEFASFEGRLAGSVGDGESITVTLCTREQAERETTSLQARLGLCLFDDYWKQNQRPALSLPQFPLARMKTIRGKNVIRETLPELLYDESRFTSGVPETVCFPQTTADVRDAVLEANRAGLSITIIGGKTGIAGGSVPIDGCMALCFSEMGRIIRVSQEPGGAMILHCDPGVTLAGITEFLKDPASWNYPVEGAGLLSPGTWLYAPDPTETTAQLGGTIATNASGAHSFRFGPTRKHVHELVTVLANGDTLRLKRGDCTEKNGAFVFTSDQGTTFTVRKPLYRPPAVKNASGYFAGSDMDLLDLFVGSEGTLGIFAECGIRLMPLPRFAAGLSFFPDRKSCFDAAAFLRAQTRVSAIEYFDESALRFLELSRSELPFDLPQLPPDRRNAVYWEYMEDEGSPFEDRMDEWESMLARHGSSFESTWSGFEPRELERLRALRHAVPETVNNAVARYKRDCPEIRKVSTDTALPAPVFERIFGEHIARITESKLEHAVFGHLGDFHLHINLVPRTTAELAVAKRLYEAMMRDTIAAGGTVSAEHGIGKLKTAYLRMMYGDDAIAQMAAVKSALDPLWLLNRGTLLEFPPETAPST
jgi:D-lactate dehydrogenase (cytochrome)